MIGKSRQKARYRIRDRAQLEALVLPARSELMVVAGAHGPVTAAELAQLLGKQRPAVHFQINILCELGLLVNVGTRGTGRGAEALFQTPGRSMEVVFDKDDPEIVELTVAYAKQVLQRAVRMVSKAFRRPDVKTRGGSRNAHVMRATCRLDAVQLKAVNHHIDELGRLCSAGTLKGSGDLFVVSLALAPED